MAVNGRPPENAAFVFFESMAFCCRKRTGNPGMQNVNIICLNLPAGPDSLQIFIKQTLCPPLSWNLYLSPKLKLSWRASVNLLPTSEKKFFGSLHLYKVPQYFGLSRMFWDINKIGKCKDPRDYYLWYNCVFGGNVLDFLSVVSASLLRLSLVPADVT